MAAPRSDHAGWSPGAGACEARGPRSACSAVSSLAGRYAGSEGGKLAGRGTPAVAPRIGPLARRAADAAGRRGPGDPHRRWILGTPGLARRARTHRRLCAADARTPEGSAGRGISRRHGLRRRGDEHHSSQRAVRRGIQSLAHGDGARYPLRAGAALVGRTWHHRQPPDAHAPGARASWARFAARALAGDDAAGAQRTAQRNQENAAATMPPRRA